jgi:hypothetical protein
MQVLILFVLFFSSAIALDVIGIGICSMIERYSEMGSLIAFLGFFVLNFFFAWQVAIRVTERFFVSDAQRKADEDYVKWVSSRFSPARR